MHKALRHLPLIADAELQKSVHEVLTEFARMRQGSGSH